MQAVRVLVAPQMGEAQWGRLHLLDGLAPAMRTMRISKDSACKGCVNLVYPHTSSQRKLGSLSDPADNA